MVVAFDKQKSSEWGVKSKTHMTRFWDPVGTEQIGKTAIATATSFVGISNCRWILNLDTLSSTELQHSRKLIYGQWN